MNETFTSQYFEYMLLDLNLKAGSTKASPRDVAKHQNLVEKDAGYSQLNASFTQAAQKLFVGLDPTQLAVDASAKELASVLKNALMNSGPRRQAMTAATKMYAIFKAH